MPKSPILVLFTAMLALAGCGSNSNSGAMTDADRLRSAEAKLDNQPPPPLTANTRFAAGQLAESQGDFGRAIQQYQEALKLDPAHQLTLMRLGMVYAQTQQYPQAIATWQQYIKVTNGSAEGYSNLGYCYQLANRMSDAEAAFKTGIAKDPTNQPCRVNYGLMLAAQNRIPEATAQLQAVLAPAEVHYNLASIYEAQGKKDLARGEYTKALEIDPTLTDAQMRLGALQ